MMASRNNTGRSASKPARFFSSSFAVFMLCLLGILILLFHRSFDPSQVIFSNDGPLGVNNSAAEQTPCPFTGLWFDLNWLGGYGGCAAPSITSAVGWVLGPLYSAKCYAPFALLFLGLSAWFFFRQLKLGPLACLLGGLAAVLNSSFFSIACWGVGPQDIAFGSGFLAMAAVLSKPPRWPWLRLIVAGLAVGIGVMEAGDIGAFVSLLVAAFIMYTAATNEGPTAQNVLRGVGRVTVVALFAVLVAAQTMSGLISTNIKGVAGAKAEERGKQEHWDWATQWSLPKNETLGLIVPGLFGYRMDTPDGGSYWGAMGQHPKWDRYFENGEQGPLPQEFLRQVGGGNYLGVLSTLVALWAALQSFRKKESVFAPGECRLLWFWVAAVPISLLLAYGRFAPFYRLVYALPYFSTIRNPAKFLNILSFTVVVLCAYGINGLSRRYLQPSLSGTPGTVTGQKSRWSRTVAFDRRWIIGSFVAVGVSLAGWLIYSRFQGRLESYLTHVHLLEQFSPEQAQEIAGAQAAFSIRQVGWFILFLVAAVAVLTAILSGAFTGRRAKWACVLLGLVLVADLGRANLPWVIYWNYKQKYASNPIIDFLRQQPFEHRVAILPFRPPPQVSLLNQVYVIEWAQHQFQYYNVQSLDIVQMSRTPQDYLAYETALAFDGTPNTLHRLARRWQLTNTRYLLGAAGYLDVLNRQIDPALHRFRIVINFNIVAKPGLENASKLGDLTAEPSTNGPYALFEFTGALPRAKLYSRWQAAADDQSALNDLRQKPLGEGDQAAVQQLGTNDFLTLKQLASPAFDPDQVVLLASPIAVSTNAGGAGGKPGTVEFSSYEPKDIKLKANAAVPSVLLLNDRYDPNWQVWVDGKQSELLRCNFVMRGVYLPSGSHTVEFLFRPPVGLLYVSLGAIGVGIVLAGLMLSGKPKSDATAEAPGAKCAVENLAKR
jgi:hypothetical protein